MMFFKRSGHLGVKRILVVSLSNIGDVLLTMPVVDALRSVYPQAALHLMIGPKARTLFDGAGAIDRVVVFDKRMPWRDKWALAMQLRRERFDLVVDLRNSMLPLILNARRSTWPVLFPPKLHMRSRHLARIARIVSSERIASDLLMPPTASIALSDAQKALVDRLLDGWRGHVLVAPGAADHRKRWATEKFIEIVRYVRGRGRKIVLVGDVHDKDAAGKIVAAVPDGVLDLCGRTSLIELAGVVERAAMALTNDSGIMHLASYFDRPVVALFGPTDPFFYGPWGSRNAVIRKGPVMDAIATDDVIKEVDRLL